MAWFEAHDTMGKHPKTLKLAEALGMKRREAVGLLHDLFSWGLYAAQKNGELANMSEIQIGLALDCETKRSARKVVSALLESGYLEQDENGVYFIHDWYDYAGRYCEERDRNRERVKAHRNKKKAGSTGVQNRSCNDYVTITDDVQKQESNTDATVTDPEQKRPCNANVMGVPIPKPLPSSSLVRQEEDDKDISRNCARARVDPCPSPRKSETLAYYCQRINAMPSSESLSLLEQYEAEMGADVCKLAIDRAIDEQIPKWSYIRGILRSWSESGIKCLADVRAADARHRQRSTSGKKQQERTVTDEFIRIAEEDGCL